MLNIALQGSIHVGTAYFVPQTVPRTAGKKKIRYPLANITLIYNMYKYAYVYIYIERERDIERERERLYCNIM